jgi:hypothetical protein
VHTHWDFGGGNFGLWNFQVQMLFCVTGNTYSMASRARTKDPAIADYSGVTWGAASAKHCSFSIIR